MAFTIVPCRRDDLDVVRGLLRDPSLQGEFWMLTLSGVLEDTWEDPYADFELRWLAHADGVPVGYLFTLVLPAPAGAWAMIRPAVLEPWRRRGIGTALLETCVTRLAAQRERRRVNELCLTAWLPGDGAAGFAARHGFERVRSFWKMDYVGPRATRGGATPVAPQWPPGIEVRVFDGGEPALRDFNDAYNASFAEHYHFVASDMEHTRAVARQRTFRPDGLVMAYRGDRCVGYCRNTVIDGRGEVALLGVVPGARGAGLGRALLRWSTAWLDRAGCGVIELMVDGQNESALALYRSEGFEVARTRGIWSRPGSPA
jgi:mycothiol synthase